MHPHDLRATAGAWHPSVARRALRQAIGLAALLAVLLAAGLHANHLPADQDEVKIATGQWRSHSAELALLFAHAGELPPRFLRAHAQQLAQLVSDSQQALDELRAPPRWRTEADALSNVTVSIQADVSQLHADPRHPAPESEVARRHRTDSLDRAEQALER